MLHYISNYPSQSITLFCEIGFSTLLFWYARKRCVGNTMQMKLRRCQRTTFIENGAEKNEYSQEKLPHPPVITTRKHTRLPIPLTFPLLLPYPPDPAPASRQVQAAYNGPDS